MVCESCTGLTYSLEGSNKCLDCPSNCVECDNTNGVCTKCDEGYHRTEDGKCKICSAGTYLSGGTEFECELCPDMTYAPTTGHSKCLDCDSTCATCDKITAECTTCNVGDKIVGTKCEICPEGTYASSITTTTCTPCEVGKYNDKERQDK